MASFYLDYRDAKGARSIRTKRGMLPHEAHQQFPAYVAMIAAANGLSVLSQTPMQAVLGLQVANAGPVPHLYVSIEPYSPPSAAEVGQPKRVAS